MGGHTPEGGMPLQQPATRRLLIKIAAKPNNLHQQKHKSYLGVKKQQPPREKRKK
jgi:hypothetical protein